MLEIIHIRNCSIRKVKSEQKELHYFNEKCHQAKVQAVLPSSPEKNRKGIVLLILSLEFCSRH